MLNDPEIDKLIIYALAGMVAVLTLALIVVSVKKNTYYVDEEGHEIDPRRVKKSTKKNLEVQEIVPPVQPTDAPVEPVVPEPVVDEPEQVSEPVPETVIMNPTPITPILNVTVMVNGHMTSHTINSYPCTIGRESSNDLVVSEPAVSRKHASFVNDGNVIYIEDVSGHNGTYLNQKKIASLGKAPIQVGDIIHLGRAEIRIEQIA